MTEKVKTVIVYFFSVTRFLISFTPYSWFWEISQKSDRSSDINKGPNHIFPKSMLKEMAQHGVDISHLEYSRPPGGHQRNIERGINTGIQKWKETMIHPDTGKDVIVIPFTFQEYFPAKDIIRGYLKDMNSGRFSNCQLAQSPPNDIKYWKPYQIYRVYFCTKFH